MAGYFPRVEPNYFTSLITLVVGVWIGYGSSKTANPPTSDSSVNSSQSNNSSGEEREEETTPLLIDKNSPLPLEEVDIVL